MRTRESEIAAQHLEHRLHAFAPSKRAPRGTDANLRFAAKQDGLLASLPEVVKQQLWKCVAAIVDQDARRALFQLARSPGFLRLEVRAQRSMLNALARDSARAEHIAEMSILAESVFFLQLAGTVQQELLSVLGKHSINTRARALLVGLEECAGFSALSVLEQLEMLRWIDGPKLLSQERGSLIDHTWDTRRLELMMIVSNSTFLAFPDELQSEVLRDFMHAAERPLSFLTELRINGRSAVIFGEVSQKDALSYGQPQHDLRYRVRETRISRTEEKALIEWIESVRGVSAVGFADQVLSTLRSMTQSRGTLRFRESFALGGKRWVAPAKARVENDADRLLKEYLSRSSRD